MFISICIPSYNRGHRAKALVEKLLSMKIPYDYEVILSNNGSTKNVEGYHEIEKIRDSRLKINTFDTNQQYYGNFNKVLKMAKGDIAIVLSDEDYIVEENIEYYVKLFEENVRVAAIRSGVGNGEDSNLYKMGKEAISHFFLMWNYISGAVYNRNIVTDEVIDKLYNDFTEKNIGYFYYPHLFVDAYCALKGNVIVAAKPLTIKGMDEMDTVYADGKKSDIIIYGTYESRKSQAEGYVELVKKVNASDGIKMQMYVMLCQKTIFLMSLVKDKYIKMGANWEDIMNNMCNELIKMIDETDNESIIKEKDLISDYIREYSKYF
ncbi:MAG: glycosyltransferase [Lachnospira sp.]|nr:glycosyltransferase [Lachnospira sp.]